jgi:hypothetical protein
MSLTRIHNLSISLSCRDRHYASIGVTQRPDAA